MKQEAAIAGTYHSEVSGNAAIGPPDVPARGAG
jgi:hypothetical protein